MPEKSISGSCACGDITFVSTTPPEHLDYCYCITCQRMAGSPFMAWMGIPKATLKWMFNSKPFTYRSTIGDTGLSVAERSCCSRCGCNIILQYQLYPDKTHVAASTIVRNDFEMPGVGCHIWTSRAPLWHKIPNDGVERYDEFDESFQTRLDNYLAGLGEE